jgi:hypothetical protein
MTEFSLRLQHPEKVKSHIIYIYIYIYISHYMDELYRYCISANYHIGFLVNENYFHVVLMLEHYVGPLF